MIRRPPRSPPFPSPTLFRPRERTAESARAALDQREQVREHLRQEQHDEHGADQRLDALGPPHRPGREQAALLPKVLARSEEHTSELQSQSNLVCRLLLEKKK